MYLIEILAYIPACWAVVSYRTFIAIGLRDGIGFLRGTTTVEACITRAIGRAESCLRAVLACGTRGTVPFGMQLCIVSICTYEREYIVLIVGLLIGLHPPHIHLVPNILGAHRIFI